MLDLSSEGPGWSMVEDKGAKAAFDAFGHQWSLQAPGGMVFTDRQAVFVLG